MSARPGPRISRTRNLPLRAGAIAAASLVAALIAGKLCINSYLHSDRFRLFVSTKTGDALHAEAEFQPFEFSGNRIYTEGLTARGDQDAAFSSLELHQVRADVSARRFFEKVWQIDDVEVQRLVVRLDEDRAAKSAAPAPQSARSERSERKNEGWLPNRVEVSSATIRDLQFRWAGGGVSKTALQARQADGGWMLEGGGGLVEHAALPAAEIASFRARYRAPSLYLQSFDLRQGGGAMNITGEVRPGDRLDLLATLRGVSATPLLPEDWRVRLHGNLDGEVRVQSSFPVGGTPRLEGSLHLLNGQLEALPVLDEIAAFTRMAQFRKLALSKASGEFRQEGSKLTVTRFVAESQGLIRLEGDFTVEKGNLAGSFQVGVTPSSLQWLPGSQEHVFTVARDGYVWTPMRLEGPLSQPREDLSPRLIAAAKGAAIDQADATARGAVKAVHDAAKSAVDLLFRQVAGHCSTTSEHPRLATAAAAEAPDTTVRSPRPSPP